MSVFGKRRGGWNAVQPIAENVSSSEFTFTFMMAFIVPVFCTRTVLVSSKDHHVFFNLLSICFSLQFSIPPKKVFFSSLQMAEEQDGDNTGSVGLLLRRMGLSMSIAGLSPGGINQ